MSSKIMRVFSSFLALVGLCFITNSVMAQPKLPPIPIPKGGGAAAGPAKKAGPRRGGGGSRPASKCPPGFVPEDLGEGVGKICVPGAALQGRINSSTLKAKKKAIADQATIKAATQVYEQRLITALICGFVAFVMALIFAGIGWILIRSLKKANKENLEKVEARAEKAEAAAEKTEKHLAEVLGLLREKADAARAV